MEGEVATISRVKLEMASHPSIHFACQASQDVKNPLMSGFYLYDGRLELSEIMKQNITNCELAFLSACQTSTGDEKLSDEAVHLAAAMLAVGYRSVVATMWPITLRAIAYRCLDPILRIYGKYCELNRRIYSR